MDLRHGHLCPRVTLILFPEDRTVTVDGITPERLLACLMSSTHERNGTVLILEAVKSVPILQ